GQLRQPPADEHQREPDRRPEQPDGRDRCRRRRRPAVCAVPSRHGYGVDEGGTRFFVACSNAYASSISRGSLHAVPVKPTPKGPGCAVKPSGNAGVGAFGTIANGTTMIG